MERGSTCMMLQLRSMLGNIICWKSIAETCGLLQHIHLKRSSMLLLRTSTSLSNLAFQFLSYSKHSNCVNSEPIPEFRSTSLLVGFMMDRQSEQLRATSKPIFWMLTNCIRLTLHETDLERNHVAYATKMIRARLET